MKKLATIIAVALGVLAFLLASSWLLGYIIKSLTGAIGAGS